MAVITPTFPECDVEEKDVIWSTLTSTNLSGKPVSIPKYADKHISIYGTWDTATLTMQGTDDPRGDPDHADHSNAVWATLADNADSGIAPTADYGSQILDNPKWIRPLMSSAGGSSDVDIAITAIRRYF